MLDHPEEFALNVRAKGVFLGDTVRVTYRGDNGRELPFASRSFQAGIAQLSSLTYRIPISFGITMLHRSISGVVRSEVRY